MRTQNTNMGRLIMATDHALPVVGAEFILTKEADMNTGTRSPQASHRIWKEEVLLHDGRRIIARRAQRYGELGEFDLSLPVHEHTISFELPHSGNTLVFKSQYGPDIERTNFNLLALHIMDGTPFLVAESNLYRPYNKWRQPAADDLLIGGTGSDTYQFNRGDGLDIITDQGDLSAIDTLQFGADVLQGDVSIRRTPAGDLEFTLTGSTDKITIQGWYTGQADANRIERIVFGDGSVLTPADFENRPITGTAGDDIIDGTTANDTLIGLAGNDRMRWRYLAANDYAWRVAA